MIHLYRIVSRWTADIETPEGLQKLSFDRVHYRWAETKKAARKAEHMHNKARLVSSPDFLVDGWRYRLVSSRAVAESHAGAIEKARESGNLFDENGDPVAN